MNITDRIRLLCDERDLTLTELERIVGIGRGVISKWGTASPNTDNLQKVADYFQVSTDYLLGRTSPTIAAHRINGFDRPLTEEELFQVTAFIEAIRKGQNNKRD